MNRYILNVMLLMIMSIVTQAESLDTNMTKAEHTPIKIKSVRGSLGEYVLIEHVKGQLRGGYITFSEDDASRTNAYALGGHYHFNTKRWNGLMIGSEAYAVVDLGINQNPNYQNGDFLNIDNESFILLSQIYLNGTWGNTEMTLGRQTLDTPHADSDDIRMIPNYFEAYTLTNTDIDALTLSLGLIDKMAGWENGVDSANFVDIGETLGVNKIDGIYYASASYEGIKDLSLSLWYYHYSDIANVLYAEAGYSHALSKDTTLTLGLQYDSSHETGTALLGQQDAQTYGVSVETAFSNLGLTVLAAYNKDNGSTGAMGLSLGGGAFFTSMEDQTLDAIGSAGEAWMIAAGYDFENVGIKGLSMGVAYGSFEANSASKYASREVDTILEYTWNEKVSLT
ncbi:MAG: OprD family outer membrane porin, partial [Campylobacterota bacterium]|nr:OprD family outer membrane porin [Campylobacterota bacterium]